jgi:hypothetical protein
MKTRRSNNNKVPLLTQVHVYFYGFYLQYGTITIYDVSLRNLTLIIFRKKLLSICTCSAPSGKNDILKGFSVRRPDRYNALWHHTLVVLSSARVVLRFTVLGTAKC